MTTPNLPSPFGRVEWLSRAAPEPALHPDLPIVDPHVHFWHHFDEQPYFVSDYARDLNASGHNVEASVFIECKAMYRAQGPEHLKSVGETEFAVGMAAMGASGKYTSSRVAGIVGFADLTLGDRTQETLEGHMEQKPTPPFGPRQHRQG
jgi:L-fuconolactonase